MYEDGKTGLCNHGYRIEMDLRACRLQQACGGWGAENVEYDVLLSCTFPCLAHFASGVFDHDDSWSNGMKMKSTATFVIVWVVRRRLVNSTLKHLEVSGIRGNHKVTLVKELISKTSLRYLHNSRSVRWQATWTHF